MATQSLAAQPLHITDPFASVDGERQAQFNMGAWLTAFILVVLLGIAFGGFITAPVLSQSQSNGTTSPQQAASVGAAGAAVLAIIAGVAVVIERSIEAVWNFVDSRVGSWWPFAFAHDAINNFVSDLDNFIKPYLDHMLWARNGIENLAKTPEDEWNARLAQMEADINAIPVNLQQVSKDLAATGIGNDQKLAVLTAGVADNVTKVLNRYPDLQKQLGEKVDLAKSITDDVNSFLATFDDNPARRIVSLVAGCLLGYAIALILRLDLFGALGIPLNGPFGPIWSAGVPITGLIMGLGSNPTHEVIQAIQQYKQAQTSSS